MVYTLLFFLQNAVCFIILTYLVPVLFTFYIQGVPNFKKIRRQRVNIVIKKSPHYMALWRFINLLRPDIGRYLIPDQTISHLPTFIFKIFLMLFYHIRRGLLQGLYPFQVLRPKLCMHFSYLPRMPPSISIALTTWRDAYRLLSFTVCIFPDQPLSAMLWTCFICSPPAVFRLPSKYQIFVYDGRPRWHSG